MPEPDTDLEARLNQFKQDGLIEDWQHRGPRETEYAVYFRDAPRERGTARGLRAAGYDLERGQFYGKHNSYFTEEHYVRRDDVPQLRIVAMRNFVGRIVRPIAKVRIHYTNEGAKQAFYDLMDLWASYLKEKKPSHRITILPTPPSDPAQSTLDAWRRKKLTRDKKESN